MRASARWSKLVRERQAETQRLHPDRHAGDPEYWNSRARRLARQPQWVATKDPLFSRVGRVAGRRTTLLDVGAGPGRVTLGFAPRVARVVAVDSSQAMIDVLTRRARRQRLANVEGVVARWPDVDVEPTDVSICSYVLPLVTDVAPFLAKLDAVTHRRAFLYLGAASLDLVSDPLWRHFHGTRRKPGPTYLDAVAVLAELGIRADVEVVEVPTRMRHADLAAAVRSYREVLALPNDPAVRRELRGLLSSWLVKDDGGLRPPLRSTAAAIVSWSPSAREGGHRPARRRA